MVRWLLFALLFCFLTDVSSQQYTESVVDENYLEDQFYAGMAYNFLLNKPANVIQRSLSYHLQFGFLKDIPLNKKRNVGIALGLGYATNSYYTNLRVLNTDMGNEYVVETENFDRSKFETHALEAPFEFRWRTSNAEDYKFWRIYTGFKVSYLFSRTSKFVDETVNESFSNEDIRQWQYGLMLNFGYNTWNVHAYYSLTSLLEDNVFLNSEEIQSNVLRIGVIFYIL